MNKDTPILITGATGFVGSYVTRLLLQQGYTQLTALRRSNSSLALLGETVDKIRWITADITDYFAVEDALEGQDIVIHCAAKVSFQPGDQQELLRVNRDGTRHVVDAALHHDIDYLLHISSVAALGRNSEGYPINEATKWEDEPLVTHYSRSKFFAELEIWRGQAEGLSVGVLYPSIIMGAGFWNAGTGRFFHYADRQPRYYPGGSTGLVDVRDVAIATLQLLVKQENGARYLINGDHLSYQEILVTIATTIGHTPPSKLLPIQWAYLLAGIERIRAFVIGSRPLLTKETVRTSYHHYRYNNEQSIKNLSLNYRNIRQTIEETATLFLTSHQAGNGILPL